MFDPRTATLDEKRDWLAEQAGWKPLYRYHTVEVWEQGVMFQQFHPVPATLDAIAKAMPEGWSWERYWQQLTSEGDDHKLVWTAVNKAVRRWPEVDDTGDELSDRATLACLCIMADKGEVTK